MKVPYILASFAGRYVTMIQTMIHWSSRTAKNLVSSTDTWADLVVLSFGVAGSVEIGLKA